MLFNPPFSPPPCPACNVQAGEDHAKGCLHLRNLRAAAFPEVLDDNGVPWQDNLIRNLQGRLADAMVEAERLRQGIRDVLPNLLGWDESLKDSESYLRLEELARDTNEV